MLFSRQSAPTRTHRSARTRRFIHAGSIGVLGVMVLAGCRGDNTPTAYNDQVKAAFVASCVGDIPPIDGATTTIAPRSYCGCAYDVFYNNVPYNKADREGRDGGKKFSAYPNDAKNFLDLEADLKDDPSKIKDPQELPQVVRDELSKCPKTDENVGSGTTVPGSVVPGSTAVQVGPVQGTRPPSSGSTPPGTPPR